VGGGTSQGVAARGCGVEQDLVLQIWPKAKLCGTACRCAAKPWHQESDRLDAEEDLAELHLDGVFGEDLFDPAALGQAGASAAGRGLRRRV
jgi:hypothetical protein